MNDGEILDLIRADPWMIRVLGAAAALGLPDWMIGAGFVRNKVWDHLHGFANAEVRTADIDLIYFDPERTCAIAPRRSMTADCVLPAM